MNGVIIFLYLLTGLSHLSAERILVISMLNSKSVKNFYTPLYLELAKRGHDLTILSPFKTSDHPNIRDIVGRDILKGEDKSNEAQKNVMDDRNIFQERKEGKSILPIAMTPYLVELCRDYYSMPEVKELMSQRFDLIIAFYTFNECGFGLIYHLQAPFILLHSNVVLPWNNPTGLPIPYSHVPLPYFPTLDKMTFYERLRNLVVGVGYGLVDDFYRIPKMEGVYREFVEGAPAAFEIAKNVSLVFTNSHWSLNFPRPMMTDVIEVGGLHCRPAKPLPEDIQEFISSSGEPGFIYFSLGSIVQAHTMPEEIRMAILKAFSKLPQKIIWKWETETMADLPANVKLAKWLPQQDILGSPKIRLFISHGGLHSLEEAIYHAVPIIGLPLYGDQDANLKNAEQFGFALTLDLNNLTESSLTWALETILNNKGYEESAKKLSRVFKDRLDKPLARAVFWTEYVLRNEGAHHLKSPARDLNFFQFHSVDSVMFLFACVSIFLYVSIRITIASLKTLIFIFMSLRSYYVRWMA